MAVGVKDRYMYRYMYRYMLKMDAVNIFQNITPKRG
jgi:hypothetical protein